MGSRQSAKLMEGTWVGLLMGAKGRMWTTEVQRVKVELTTIKKFQACKLFQLPVWWFTDLFLLFVDWKLSKHNESLAIQNMALFYSSQLLYFCAYWLRFYILFILVLTWETELGGSQAAPKDLVTRRTQSRAVTDSQGKGRKREEERHWKKAGAFSGGGKGAKKKDIFVKKIND